MPDKSNVPNKLGSAVPPDDLQGDLAVARADTDQKLRIGVVGGTYTILLHRPKGRGLKVSEATSHSQQEWRNSIRRTHAPWQN